MKMVRTEHERPEEESYVEFLRRNGHPNSAVFLHNLHDFLISRASEVLGPMTIKALEDSEAAGDHSHFMEILIANKPRLDISIGNFLYHRWIRMHTLERYSASEREVLQSIPIAFVPFYPFLEAFITKTPYGHIICFTESLNSVLFSVFLTMAKSIHFRYMTPAKPQLSISAAEERIITLARHLVGGCKQETLPSRLEVEERLILAGDLLNNVTQSFILAHEYNHFLLGHLRDSQYGVGMLPVGNFRHVESFNTNLDQEVEADELAVKHLKDSNRSASGIQFNATLCSGVHAFLTFAMICKKLLGYSAGTLFNEEHRMAKITEAIFGDADRVYLLEEIGILRGALDKL